MHIIDEIGVGESDNTGIFIQKEIHRYSWKFK